MSMNRAKAQEINWDVLLLTRKDYMGGILLLAEISEHPDLFLDHNDKGYERFMERRRKRIRDEHRTSL